MSITEKRLRINDDIAIELYDKSNNELRVDISTKNDYIVLNKEEAINLQEYLSACINESN